MPYKDKTYLKRKRQAEIAQRPTVCPVCERPAKLVYDHDHETGEFRNFICNGCNLALGHAKDNPRTLRKLIEYLMKEELRDGDDPEKVGVKYDKNKTRYDLVPVEGIKAVAEILGAGAEKYGERNWERGLDWSRPFGACLRHLFAWWEGEDKDKDSGRSHLWHAACNIFFLIAYQARGTGKDDRSTSTRV